MGNVTQKTKYVQDGPIVWRIVYTMENNPPWGIQMSLEKYYCVFPQ